MTSRHARHLIWPTLISLTVLVKPCMTPPSPSAPNPDLSNIILRGVDEFPGKTWKTLKFEAAGIDAKSFGQWMDQQRPAPTNRFGEVHGKNEWGAALVRGGYLIATWGNPNYRYQSASVGKAFTKMCLQIAIDKGLIKSDTDLVSKYWTGEGELSHPNKYLNRGYHKQLTFRHLWQHRGGFPVSNGNTWRKKSGVPSWAKWSGDPALDNYSQAQPGKHYSYASGGYWRMTQALTFIFGRSLKEVLDEHVMSKIGIPADAWEWMPGEEVKNHRDMYPGMQGYGEFVDPPYRIKGKPCVGGGGWVVMSPLDLCRVGLLVAHRGKWRGTRLIGDTSLLAGHAGGNDSDLKVESGSKMLVFAKVTTTKLGYPGSVKMSAWKNP